MYHHFSMLTDIDSPLGALYARATRHFLNKIEPAYHASVYRGEHGIWFAESEFAGKYLDISVQYAKSCNSPEAISHARTVVESILSNQREDGYIGGLSKKDELSGFSVWNQAFTMFGLLSYYDFTHDARVLSACEGIVSWAADAYMYGDGNIMGGWNNGSQHLSLLLPLVRLCRISEKPVCRKLLDYMIEKIKASSIEGVEFDSLKKLGEKVRGSHNNFFSFSSILQLCSKKGIENFVILIGILEYGALTGDSAALPACEKYWEELNRTQIRDNGNGTLCEVWTEGGNQPRLLGLDVKPDENCVAVGWIEFCMALFFATGKARYLDAAEITYYNHLCGALAEDGHDFAYYQPNFGRRVTSTAESMYKCCRYRGYSAVAYLPEMLFRVTDDTIQTGIYANASYRDDTLCLNEETDYPMGGHIVLTVSAEKTVRRKLCLRVPAKVEGALLSVNGKALADIPSDGWFTVDRTWEAGSITRLDLTFSPKTVIRQAEIDGVMRMSVSIGPILLAAETDNTVPEGTWDMLSVDPAAPLVPVTPNHSLLAFRIGSTILTDFASSGRDGREFVVWFRIEENRE